MSLLTDAFTNSSMLNVTPSVFFCTSFLSINTVYLYLLLIVKNLTCVLSLVGFDSLEQCLLLYYSSLLLLLLWISNMYLYLSAL